MADVEVSKQQTLISIDNSDAVCNDTALSTNALRESGVSVETTGTVNESFTVVVSKGVAVSTDGEDQSCTRIGQDDQSNNSNVAVKVDRRRRKRTSVNEQVASAAAETTVKRRRVQHNYRRLSSAGYVDDYDGRERFSGKPPARNGSSPLKQQTVGSLSGPTTSRQGASKMTRSRSDAGTDTVQGQCVFDTILKL